MSDAIRNVTINLNLQRGDIQSDEIKRELASIAAASSKMKADFEQLVRTAGDGLTTALEQSVASMVTLQGEAAKMMGGVGTSLQEAIAAQKALAETGRVYTDSMGGASRAGEAHTRLLDDWLKRRNALNDAAAEYERRAKAGIPSPDSTPAQGARPELTPATGAIPEITASTEAIEEQRNKVQQLRDEYYALQDARDVLFKQSAGNTWTLPAENDEEYDRRQQKVDDKAQEYVAEVERLNSLMDAAASGQQPTPAQGARPAPTPATGAQPDSTPATGRASQIPEITAALEAAGKATERFQQLAENASSMSTWELAVKQNEALRDGLQESADALQALVREAQSLDEAAALGRELGAALAEVAENAGMLDSVETAANMIADAEQKAMDVWTEAHKERMAMRKEEERSAKQWAKEQASLDKELEKLRKEHTAMQEEAAKEAARNEADRAAAQRDSTRNTLQAGVATGQLLASIRLLGGESKAIDELARDFMMLQAAIQAMNQGYTIFTSATDAIDAYRRAAQLAATSNAAMTATAAPAATATAAAGSASLTAAGSVSGLNVAMAAALPLLAALAVRHWAWHRVQLQNAQMEEQMRRQISLTTGTINSRTDALQRYIDLEKSQREFADANRPETKTRKEIVRDFEQQRDSDKKALQFEASRALRNQFEKAQDKKVSGDSVIAMQRTASQNINSFRGGTVGEARALLEREQDEATTRLSRAPEGSLDRFNIEKDLKDIAGLLSGIDRESGISDLRRANKEVMDGTDAEELSQLSGMLSGAGQFGAGDQLGAMAKASAEKQLQATLSLEAAAKQSMQSLDQKIAEMMAGGDRALQQSVFEERSVGVRERFDLEEGNQQQLRALQARATEGQQYPEGRQQTFNDLVSFAESKGLASDAIPEWQRAKLTQDTEVVNAILNRLGRGETDEAANKQADKLAEAVDELRRQRQALELIKFTEFADAARESADAAEKVELSQRAVAF